MLKKPNIRTKIAICFFGITRSLSYTIDSIRKSIIQPASCLAEVKVYGHIFKQHSICNPRSGEFGELDVREQELLRCDHLEQEEPKICLEQWNFPQLQSYGDSWNDEFRSLSNLIHQLHSLRSVTVAAMRYQPDIFVFCRPDLQYHDSFHPFLVRAMSCRNPVVWVPGWQAHGGFNDRFAICKGKGVAAVYGKRIELASRFCSERLQPLNGELLLKFALERATVCCRKVCLTASRVRSNGKVVNEDFRADKLVWLLKGLARRLPGMWSKR